MNNDRNGRSGRREPDGDEALRELFAHAAPREAPPDRDAEEIRRAVYAEWDAVTGRRVLWRRLGAAAAAAAVVAALLFAMVDQAPPPVSPTVAQVERLQGTVQIAAAGGQTAALRAGAAVAEGATLVTGTGQVALRLASGGSLRLGPQTRVTLSGASAADLAAGELYFDSERSGRSGQPFAVVTALGTVRDVGTQFIARLDAVALAVGVRDGNVTVARGAELASAAAGERLTAGEGAAAIRREPIATFGDEWAWAERLAPPFEIDGRPLIDFLEWVAGQTGRTLSFADAAAERVARDTVLKGSIDLEPMPKLVAVLALTDLDYSVDEGRLLIVAR